VQVPKLYLEYMNFHLPAAALLGIQSWVATIYSIKNTECKWTYWYWRHWYRETSYRM